MEYAVKTGAPEKQKTDCLIVPVFQGGKLGTAGKSVDAASDGYIADAVKSAGDTGRLGRTVLLFRVPGVAARKVMLLGLGKADELSPRELRKAAKAAGVCALDNGVTDAIAAVLADELADLDEYRIARHVIEAVDYAVYRYDETKSKKEPAPRFKKLALLADDQAAAKKAREGAKHAQGIGRGVAFARELGNLPGNVCTPNYLAKQARKLGRDNPKLKVSVLDEAEMKKLGMGSLLSVSRGSREPAKLIVMEYRNGPKSQKPVALVGKGLTFDAGGISLKPAPAMDEMKFDMCGGAGVFGAVAAVSEMELPINLVALVPASENLPDGAANKPGDIVTSMSGQTIEILNTDAEGRLILCDALTYARRYKPDTVIDLATLTGACVVALGSHATGLLTKDEELASELTEAGERAWDRTWRLPLWDDYQQQLESNFADMANVGGKEAGTVTAGCFLSRFTEGLRWAHLDIAGTAWNSGGDKGATGRPVSLLVEYLISRA